MSGFKEVFRRREIKYLLSRDQYEALMPYLVTVARVDEYGLSKINNIYFDTPDHQLVRTSMEKPLYKEKLRLRTYGATENDSNAFIEIKKKYAGIVYKRRISGRYQDAYDYLTGGYVSGPFDPSQIAREVDAFLKQYKTLQPTMRICYERIAMAGIRDEQFRVTFDRNITWNAGCLDLRKESGGRGLLDYGQCLMEIKVSNAMPMELASILSEWKIFPVSFSKYGSGYADLMRMGVEQKAKRSAVANPVMVYGLMKGEAAYV